MMAGNIPQPQALSNPQAPALNVHIPANSNQSIFIPYRRYQLRFDWRVTVPASPNPESAMRDAILKVLQKLRTADRTIIVYGYYSSDPDKSDGRPYDALTSPESLPQQVDALQKYFPRAIPKGPEGGNIFPQVHLGLTIPWQAISKSLNHWFGNTSGVQVWLRPVQSEKTTIVGWGLYSTLGMSRELLAKTLSDKLQVELGIRWRIINTDKVGIMPKEEQVRAFHFEVAKQDRRKAAKGLFKLYSTSSTEEPPLGIALRIVPIMDSLMGDGSRMNATTARKRQKAFAKHMKFVKSTQITDLDVRTDDDSYTIREHIMAIRRKDDIEKRLFFSVDPHFKEQNAVVFMFHPDVETEAHTMIACLLPFLRHNLMDGRLFTNPDHAITFLQRHLYCYFSDSAIESSDGVTWDPAKWDVDSPRNQYVREVLDGDAEFHFESLEMLEESTPTNPSELDRARKAEENITLKSFGNMTTTSLTVDTAAVADANAAALAAAQQGPPSANSSLSGSSTHSRSEVSLIKALQKLGSRFEQMNDNPAIAALKSQVQAATQTAASLVPAPASKKKGD